MRTPAVLHWDVRIRVPGLRGAHRNLRCRTPPVSLRLPLGTHHGPAGDRHRVTKASTSAAFNSAAEPVRWAGAECCGGTWQLLAPCGGCRQTIMGRGTTQDAAKTHTYALPVILSACPDRFSYPDAAAYVGYPFRTRVQSWDNSLGPLDIILFFRTITDAQIRRHLGNPDIHVTKEEWGYFAADPERYIQVAYLLNCTSSRDLERKLRRFLTWLDEYEQVGNLINRARIRGRILQAENEARRIN